jgi:hypothetical protein
MNLLRRLRSNQRGMSATETSVFLLAASLVTSAGAPAVDDYVNLARARRGGTPGGLRVDRRGRRVEAAGAARARLALVLSGW